MGLLSTTKKYKKSMKIHLFLRGLITVIIVVSSFWVSIFLIFFILKHYSII